MEKEVFTYKNINIYCETDGNLEKGEAGCYSFTLDYEEVFCDYLEDCFKIINEYNKEYKMENIKIDLKADYKVRDYYNRWSIIDTYGDYALLENNTYGDETCFLVVEMNKNNLVDKQYKTSTGEVIVLPTFLEVVCETYDDIITALRDEEIL